MLEGICRRVDRLTDQEPSAVFPEQPIERSLALTQRPTSLEALRVTTHASFRTILSPANAEELLVGFRRSEILVLWSSEGKGVVFDVIDWEIFEMRQAV